jgi:hypothetical protein
MGKVPDNYDLQQAERMLDAHSLDELIELSGYDTVTFLAILITDGYIDPKDFE